MAAEIAPVRSGDYRLSRKLHGQRGHGGEISGNPVSYVSELSFRANSV